MRAVPNDVTVKVPGVGSPTDTKLAKTITHIDAGKIEVGIESGDVTLTGAVSAGESVKTLRRRRGRQA